MARRRTRTTRVISGPGRTDPAGQAAQAFAAFLSADGIRVTGPGGQQKAAAHAATIASVSSPPLSAIVGWMLRESNNVIAENLARQVALRERRPASFSGAAAAVTAIARRLGVAGGIHLVDGSGLSPQDRIAPAALARLVSLASAGTRGRLRAAITGMPVAGFSGTLAPGQSVFGGFTARSRGLIRAKTGNLSSVATLAGLVYDASGRLLAFAFMTDQVPAHGPRQGRGWARPDGLRTGRLRLPRPVNRGPSQGTTGQQAAPALPSTYGGGVSSGQMIDWDVAISTGVRWARPGPQVSLGEARAVVAELRALADQVSEPVRAVTGMSGPGEDGSGWVAVVDRPGWIRANVDGFRVVLDPLAERLRERGNAPGGAVVTAVGSRVTGVQAGLILAYLSGRVLGQYELFLPPDPSSPNGVAPAWLTLVAPNIVMVERELGVNPHDFRRWVCLHEETHRTQFTSVPWLRGYVQEQMSEFLLASDLDPATILGRLRSAADAVAGAVRDGGGDSVLEAIQSPRQREILDRLTSVMTLVEGHGDYVMDAVGPQVVPSVEQIRQRFNERRGTGGRIERTLRRILGIDLKMKQYAQGSRFVKAVVDEAGMATFNKVWTSPQTLPTKDEFVHPELWLDRVGRGGALAAGG